MTSDRGVRRVLRIARRAAAAALLTALLAALAGFPFAGRFLVVNDPLERSDAVFVLAGARVERWLEGVDLYHAGWAPVLVLSPGRSEPAERHLRSRGIAFPSETDLVARAIAQLRVPADALLVLPHEVDNTAQEAIAIRELCVERGWTRLIVVTSKYHSRRTRMAFERELGDSGIRVLVRTSRYDGATPERWWQNRGDIRYVVAELQKLLLYRLGLRG